MGRSPAPVAFGRPAVTGPAAFAGHGRSRRACSARGAAGPRAGKIGTNRGVMTRRNEGVHPAAAGAHGGTSLREEAV
ncbi:hypothetical protein GCM10009727_82630 [Actinomadura napierensis]|uniref:Uncharacterized protein n=1 Tax=Actinomadura napierensis TaxID=267854 RepID=A0ABN3AF44_9ACTN